MSSLSKNAFSGAAQPSTEEAKALGRKLLHATIRPASADVARLIREGAALDEKDSDGKTAMIWAAWHGYDDIAGMLINAGAKLDEKGNDGWSALVFAAANARDDIAQKLIRGGADIDTKDNDGRTPLDWAESLGDHSMIHLLREAGVAREKEQKIEQEKVRAAEFEKIEAVAYGGCDQPLESAPIPQLKKQPFIFNR